MRRRVLLMGLGMGVLVALGACGPSNQGGKEGSPTPAKGEPTANSTKPLKVGLVMDEAGIDDKSFNAAAYKGLQRAITELGIDKEKARYIESKTNADYKTNMTQLATQGYDVVVAVGFAMFDSLKEIAPQFPNTKFAIVDSAAPEGAANCVGLMFKEEQGTFLAGYLAASMSKSKKIGFVGGQKIPLIEKFEIGYRAGAKTADPNVQVLVTYTNTWNDLNKGKSQAEQLFGNGADVIFHASGKCGLGVIAAAKEKGAGFYAIGVDSDQDDVAPGRVLTSMVKRVDNAVFDVIQKVKEGKFTGGNTVYDITQKGIGLSERKFTKQDIPPKVTQHLDDLEKALASGKIVAPSTAEALAKFQAPKLD